MDLINEHFLHLHLHRNDLPSPNNKTLSILLSLSHSFNLSENCIAIFKLRAFNAFGLFKVIIPVEFFTSNT